MSKDYSASVMAVIKQFGYDLESVNSKKVHSLYNVMTMELLSHHLFDHLELWFEEMVSVLLIICLNLPSYQLFNIYTGHPKLLHSSEA